MKNLYIKSFAAIFGMSVLAGCGENSWNDHLDGFEEPPIYSKTEAITYQLTQIGRASCRERVSSPV